MTNPHVILGDGLAGMCALRAGCASLVLCDLPSGETRAPFDTPVDLGAFFSASWHALRADGVVAVMASSFRFAAACVAAGGRTFRYDMIWNKSVATGFLNAKRCPLRSHEYLLVFSRSGSFCYRPQMVETGVPISKASTPGRTHGDNYGRCLTKTGMPRAGATDRYPRSVIDCKCVGSTNPGRTHPQQKPDELFRLMIRTHTRRGELVLDPCAGSGTTHRAAEAEGRTALCWDLSPRFGSPLK
jgi:DNA methylase